MHMQGLSAKSKALAWLAVLGMLALIVGYALEFWRLSNTMHVGRLVLVGIFTGLILGSLVAMKLASSEIDLVSKLRWWVAVPVLAGLFGPLLISWIDRLPFGTSKRTVQAVFMEEKPFAQERFGIPKGEKIEPDGYFIFLMLDGSLERFRSRRQQFPNATKGDTVTVQFSKGLLGFERIEFD